MGPINVPQCGSLTGSVNKSCSYDFEENCRSCQEDLSGTDHVEMKVPQVGKVKNLLWWYEEGGGLSLGRGRRRWPQ